MKGSGSSYFMNIYDKWKTLSQKIIFDSKWYQLIHNKVELPTKKIIDYYVVSTNGSAMIVPVTEKGNIIFVRQYRYPIDEITIELPCGGVEQNSHLEAATYELEEEIGYKSNNLKKIGEFQPFNGVSSETCHVYLAKNLIQTKQKLEETEFIEVLERPIEEAYKMVENNEIKDGMTLAALSLARKYLIN